MRSDQGGISKRFPHYFGNAAANGSERRYGGYGVFRARKTFCFQGWIGPGQSKPRNPGYGVLCDIKVPIKRPEIGAGSSPALLPVVN